MIFFVGEWMFVYYDSFRNMIPKRAHKHPDSTVHGAHLGPTWPMLALWTLLSGHLLYWIYFRRKIVFSQKWDSADYWNRPFCGGRQGPLYPAYSLPWLVMSWRRKEPGHQQSWHWPICSAIPVLAPGGTNLLSVYVSFKWLPGYKW